ncbi:hypothetical protein ACGFNV_34045 [Streptomyces sp. NPDC048751]|uniref:hypothetical protein n=1 Tax=Streptomyces sp. NPDC048751 TaxID=3365591 RepID=UPI003718A72B
MRNPLTLHTALLPHLLRLVPRAPMALGGGTAFLLCALPLAVSTHLEPGDAALLLRLAAVLCTAAAAFALDDPAARTTATQPLPLEVRRSLRLALTLAPLAAIWTAGGILLRAALNPDDRVALPLAGLSLEAAALGAATILLTALGLRLSRGERGSTLAAPGGVLLPLLLVLSPARSQLFAVPPAESWTSSRWVWATALTVAVGTAAVLLRERPLGTRRASAAHTAPTAP